MVSATKLRAFPAADSKVFILVMLFTPSRTQSLRRLSLRKQGKKLFPGPGRHFPSSLMHPYPYVKGKASGLLEQSRMGRS